MCVVLARSGLFVSNVCAKLAQWTKDVSGNREQKHSFENIVLNVESFFKAELC